MIIGLPNFFDHILIALLKPLLITKASMSLLNIENDIVSPRIKYILSNYSEDSVSEKIGTSEMAKTINSLPQNLQHICKQLDERPWLSAHEDSRL